MTLIERVLSKYVVNAETGCWEWTASLGTAGYGQIRDGRRTLRAHRVSYEHAKGPIPPGLHLDHLCRVPICINPDHLEPVTNRENSLRGQCGATNAARQRSLTHCKHGHPLSGDNLYVNRQGYRICRACGRTRARRHVGGLSGRASAGPLRPIVERLGDQLARLSCGHTVHLTNKGYARARCESCEPLTDIGLPEVTGGQ